MRKITKESIAAFNRCFTFSKENMTVQVAYGKTGHPEIDNNYEGNFRICILSLHGNNIAYKINDKDIYITNCGWETNTTKERLNAIKGVSIFQKNWTWYLNGIKWDGRITKIN